MLVFAYATYAYAPAHVQLHMYAPAHEQLQAITNDILDLAQAACMAKSDLAVWRLAVWRLAIAQPVGASQAMQMQSASATKSTSLSVVKMARHILMPASVNAWGWDLSARATAETQTRSTILIHLNIQYLPPLNPAAQPGLRPRLAAMVG